MVFPFCCCSSGYFYSLSIQRPEQNKNKFGFDSIRWQQLLKHSAFVFDFIRSSLHCTLFTLHRLERRKKNEKFRRFCIVFLAFCHFFPRSLCMELNSKVEMKMNGNVCPIIPSIPQTACDSNRKINPIIYLMSIVIFFMVASHHNLFL